MALNPLTPGPTPDYATTAPDSPIRLATGRFAVLQGSYTGEGDGTLDLIWASRPKLRFHVPALEPPGLLHPGACVLRLVSANAQADASVANAHYSEGPRGLC